MIGNISTSPTRIPSSGNDLKSFHLIAPSVNTPKYLNTESVNGPGPVSSTTDMTCFEWSSVSSSEGTSGASGGVGAVGSWEAA